uniref:Killer cell lectin-like receptor subfamily B member 1B allele B n=1 Tax=Taeniopygia guttata TaxID=59729 RepID=A0A674GMM6_TAEGU|nr:asialoglycoprotein receptor 1 isoform X1 [Taeniopygia guttata]
MAENVINSDLNLPEPTRSRVLTVPDVQGKSHGFRTRVAALVAVLVVLLLLVVMALYLTVTVAGSQQDSTALTSTSQKVSSPLSPTNQENSTKVPPSHEEAPGRSCCSTTRVAVLVTEIILLLLIVVCQILPCKSRCSRTQAAVLVAVLVPIVVALALSWALPHAPTAGSQEDSTRTIPAVALDGPTAGSQEDSTRTIPAEALGCPTAWKKHGRSCYFFSPETKPKSWEASRAECTAMGSDLVVIESREELRYLLLQSRHNYYLLGLRRSEEGQKWKWINNVELDPNMFRLHGRYRDYLCTAIGYDQVHTAPCDGSQTIQNMCEKAATIP